MSATGRRVGIDLGTTNSVVAIVDPEPRVLPSDEGRDLTRSCVGVKRRKKATDAEILVGDIAYDNLPMAPKDTIVSVKRLMGRSVDDAEIRNVQEWAQYQIVAPSDGTRDSIRVMMDGNEYSPVEISAMIMRKLRTDAEVRLGGEKVTHAVITVPAYFSQIQCAATKEAALQAGLKVIRVLDEPTAAAVAYGINSRDSSEAKAQTILVYDLGGGTFDVSILVYGGNNFATLNVEGNMWLGGDNFDQVLVDRVVKEVQKEYGVDATANARFIGELRKQAQVTKERLSRMQSTEVLVPGLLHDGQDLIDVESPITRPEFEEMVGPLIARTVELVHRALENAHLEPKDIDVVLLAGNATNMPLAQQAVTDIFGREKVRRTLHPKHCVAYGAAITAASLNRIYCIAPDPANAGEACGHANPWDAEVCEICGAGLEPSKEETARAEESEGGGFQIGTLTRPAPFDYGIQTAGDKFNVFIHKGDPFPTKVENRQVQRFQTQTANQRMISIPVYGGMKHERASANELQGQAFAVLPPGLHEGTDVLISLWLDEDQVFDLSAQLGDGTPLEPWIQHGEPKDGAGVVACLDELDRELSDAASMSAGKAEAVESARRKAFDRMNERDFDGAASEVDEAMRILREPEGPDDEDPRVKAERLIGFAEFVLHEYAWALDPNAAYRWSKLIEETRSALESDDPRELEQKIAALDKATDKIPQVVKLLLSMKAAIVNRIRPHDASAAQELMEELTAAEEELKANPAAAQAKLVRLMARVSEKMTEVEKRLNKPTRCKKCGASVPPGERRCPKCGEDQLLLDAVDVITSSSQDVELGSF